MIQDKLKLKMETNQIVSVNTIETVLTIKMNSKSIHENFLKLKDIFKKNEIIFPQILSIDSTLTQNFLYITAPDEVIELIKKIKITDDFEISQGLTTICLTCTGVPSFETQSKISEALQDAGIRPLKLQMSAMSVILFLNKQDLPIALRKLHELIDPPTVG